MSLSPGEIDIENVVASTGIGSEIDLPTLSIDLDSAEYDPERFPGIIYRTNSPRATVLIFRTGKMVCTGADSITAAEDALHDVLDRLAELKIEAPESPSIEVQNIVSSGTVGNSVNLNAASIGLGLENVEYEPEQFPGLVYRVDDLEVVTLLFGSGKTVITGGKSVEEAQRGLDQLHSELSDLGLLEN